MPYHPMRAAAVLFLLAGSLAVASSAQPQQSWLIGPGEATELPRVTPNDNRVTAGTPVNGVVELDLELVLADFRVEEDEGPGLRVIALAEVGKHPTIPGPLIRVERGTDISVRLHNTLPDSTITVFGFQERPAEHRDSLVVPPGEIGSVRFNAGQPGTYFYRIRVGRRIRSNDVERDVLSGALIIDPPGGSPSDRVFVMNIWGQVDSTVSPTRYLEALTVNGKSWPFTELQRSSVGDTLRWRVINASARNHPMHLHGFFYDVLSRGTLLQDETYAPEDRRHVVTETMLRRSTMAMEWIARRPGRWLFHCHLSFHVAPDIRLPRPATGGDEAHKVHMAGLVLGIEIEPGPTDLISVGEPRRFTLYANEYPNDSLYTYGFSLDPDFRPDSLRPAAPGPLLLLKQHQPTYVTVQNNMSIPTGVHWHGLELDGWADGVPGWSASDGRVSPVIPPGESFTYKLSLMRPGSFIYHSHLDDVHQLTGGLYGPMIVLGEDATYDPATDHFAIVGWRTPNPSSFEDVELNGRTRQPDQLATVGEAHRIRVMNIAPAGMITVRMLKEETAVPLKALAKDGADLPPNQQVAIDVSPRLGVGEAADYEFVAGEPGTYELVIGYRRAKWRQKWIVSDAIAVD